MAEGGNKLLKFLLFVFNLIFWVSGIGLIVAGALAQTVYSPYITFLDSTYYAAPVVLIVVGAAVAIIAFFGCCGSSKENYCMLMTFAVLLGIVFLVELAGGIAAYLERGRVDGYLGKHMNESAAVYEPDNNKSLATVAWDTVQPGYHCCGVDSFNDWKVNSNFTRPGGQRVPVSCCTLNITLPVLDANNKTVCDRTEDSLKLCLVNLTSRDCPIYTEGCKVRLERKFIDTIGIIGGVGVGVAFIQLVGIAFACILACRVKRGYAY